MVWDENFVKVCKWDGPAQIFISLDSLHSLACLWTCEDGIWRRHPESQIASFLFQDINSQRENGSSKMITRPIRCHISKDVPKNEKYVFRLKYLRTSPKIEISAHRDVYFFDIHARSVHSLVTNQERYLDQNILVLTLPGVYSLNVWVDTTPKKSYPRFYCLGPHVTEQAHFLIKDLYIEHIPQFKWYRSLYPVLLASTNSLVMYHCYVGTHIGHKN